MLNIFCGRESTDKEKFIFDQIKGRTLLLVPDQFSLQAERDAFFYLQKKGLMDLRIVDFSTLGHKVAAQVGGRRPQLIDKYGRHMLLTRVLDKTDRQLRVYRGQGCRNSFIDRMNSLISEMKRYGVDPEALRTVAGRLDENTYLRYKLEDIIIVYEAYQDMIKGKYLDSEDYIDFYGEKILQAPMIAESEIWIYGFDTFTPKNLLVIERLLTASRGVNIVMTYQEGDDLFHLTEFVMGRLMELAAGLGKQAALHTIEGMERRTVWNRGDLPVTLVAASNLYAEAERAAAYILHLVRDKGMRFGDMVVVCNDMDLRGGILRRTFLRWGIPVFMDRKRKVLHHAAVRFLLSLMECMTGGYRTDAVMRMIKSGLMGFSQEDAELLENYAAAFRIRGAMWKSDFTRGADTYDAGERNRINSLRATVVDTIERARERKGVRNTVAEKLRGLYGFLDEDFDMRQRLEELIRQQEAAGFAEGAAETAQSWNVICEIMDQMAETLGDQRISDADLLKLMQAGLEEIEIGLVPVSADHVMIGTMQRTRLSRVKVLLAVGANDGVMPLDRREEGLLSDREKETLEGFDLEVSKRDDIAGQEERLAIHRTLFLPEEALYVSCCGMDEKGEALRPSEVFTALRQYAEKAGVEVLSDLGADGSVTDMLTCSKGAIVHMAEAFREYVDGGSMNEDWLQVAGWYEEHDLQAFRRMKRGMLFDNRLEALGDRFADALYRGEKNALSVSASRLEKYSSCPFSHFIAYGLRAREQVRYEMGAREIGDVYHQCLMRLSRRLTPAQESSMDVDDPASLWMTVTQEQIRSQVRDILEKDLGFFREGLMHAGQEEVYRTGRIAEICCRAAWSMIQQVRKSRVKKMYFEYPFGHGKPLPPVTVDAGGRQVVIQGKIDRMDVLRKKSDGDAFGAEAGEDASEAVRIVDYKTGGDTIDPEYFRSGYKLQLMVYLDAALKGISDNAEPAGVFHFRIRDLDTDADERPSVAAGDTLAKRMEETYRLEGIVLNDERIVEAMDDSLEGNGASGVIPVKVSKKDGSLMPSGGGYLLSREAFSQLTQQVENQVERICREICSGRIDIMPKRESKKDMDGSYRTPCRFCGYRSICMFDTAFPGCRYDKA